MEKRFNKLKKLIAFALSFSIFSCHNTHDIGLGLGGDTIFGSFYTDTLNIKYSTVLSDSAVNSNNIYVLMGKANDPIFGPVEATAYFTPSLSPLYTTSGTIATNSSGQILYDSLKLDKTPILDSLKLRLYTSGVHYGDTNAVVKYKLHRLTQPMKSKNYDATESLPYDSKSIAEFQFKLKDLKNDSTGAFLYHFVKLPIDVAKDLYESAKKANGNNTSFIEQVKGFAIVPDPNNKAIYGFNASMLDYNKPNSSILTFLHFEGDTTGKAYELAINGPRFTNFKFNRTQTALKSLTKQNNELPLSASTQHLYLQAGSGISTKVDLSPIKNLGNIKIVRAILEFRTDPTSHNGLYPKSYYLTIAETDKNNQQKRNSKNQLTYIMGSDSESLVGSYTQLADSSNYTSINLTSYLQKLELTGDFNKQILVLPAMVNSSSGSASIINDNLNRLVFLKPRLLLYYDKK